METRWVEVFFAKSSKHADVKEKNVWFRSQGILSREFWTYVQHKIKIFTQNTNLSFIKGLNSSFMLKSKHNFMAAF